MKKLLMASAVLFLFSASIMMFQISCSKTANAGTTITTGVASKIVYMGSTQSSVFLYIKNADGSGSTTTINPVLPSGYSITASDKAEINCDGTYIYFVASGTTVNTALFRCDLNGANPKILTNESDVKGYFTIY